MDWVFRNLAEGRRRAYKQIGSKKGGTCKGLLLNCNCREHSGRPQWLADRGGFCRMCGDTQRATNGRISGFRPEVNVACFADCGGERQQQANERDQTLATSKTGKLWLHHSETNVANIVLH